MDLTSLKAPLKTGWPAPALAQDDHRPLFKWFASRLDARRLVREACAAIRAAATIAKESP